MYLLLDLRTRCLGHLAVSIAILHIHPVKFGIFILRFNFPNFKSVIFGTTEYWVDYFLRLRFNLKLPRTQSLWDGKTSHSLYSKKAINIKCFSTNEIWETTNGPSFAPSSCTESAWSLLKHQLYLVPDLCDGLPKTVSDACDRRTSNQSHRHPGNLWRNTTTIYSTVLNNSKTDYFSMVYILLKSFIHTDSNSSSVLVCVISSFKNPLFSLQSTSFVQAITSMWVARLPPAARTELFRHFPFLRWGCLTGSLKSSKLFLQIKFCALIYLERIDDATTAYAIGDKGRLSYFIPFSTTLNKLSEFIKTDMWKAHLQCLEVTFSSSASRAFEARGVEC